MKRIYFLLLVAHSCICAPFIHGEIEFNSPKITLELTKNTDRVLPEDFSIEEKDQHQPLIIFSKKLEFKDYPNSFNPSLIHSNLGFILTFRYYPDPMQLWISYIGIVILDEELCPISQPQILNTRPLHNLTPSQTEDARVFSFQGKLYITYNDNPEITNPNGIQRRDVYIAEIRYIDEQFQFSNPIKLFHQTEYFTRKWQKNWMPFEWNGNLLFSYSYNPHEILYPNLATGECTPIYKTKIDPIWIFGEMRGGTPALLVDGEYLTFFHSSVVMESNVSNKQPLHHYFMGAFTFSADPPFNITKISPAPILDKGFYTQSDYEKRVIFPSGFVALGSYLYVAYGKDDQEIWIAKINKKQLQSSLIHINKE